MTTFSEKLARAWRHLRTTTAVGKRAFPANTLSAITDAISAGEQTHRSELRLIVENNMPFELVWNDVNNRQRALALFAEYGVWDTEENCGVLVYINLAERKVDIVADRHIGRKIEQPQWQTICTLMTSGFARGEFHDSTLAAVEQVNALLRQHFPANGARANELPNQPLIL